MITYSDSKGFWEMYGKSTDAKPVHEDVPNGSSFIEIDTSKVFLFDGEEKEWVEFGGEV